MFSDFSQGLRNFESFAINYQADLEDEFEKEENEFDENLAYDNWRDNQLEQLEWQDWCAEQNIRQAETNF